GTPRPGASPGRRLGAALGRALKRPRIPDAGVGGGDRGRAAVLDEAHGAAQAGVQDGMHGLRVEGGALREPAHPRPLGLWIRVHGVFVPHDWSHEKVHFVPPYGANLRYAMEMPRPGAVLGTIALDRGGAVPLPAPALRGIAVPARDDDEPVAPTSPARLGGRGRRLGAGGRLRQRVSLRRRPGDRGTAHVHPFGDL